MVWMALFAPKQNQRLPQRTTSGKTAPEKVPENTGTPVGPGPAEARGTAKQVPEQPVKVDEKTVTVTTPLYRAVFSNAGPTIKSFELKKYRQTIKKDSPLIQLVHLGPNPVDFMRMDFLAGSFGAGGTTICRVDKDTIRLKPGSAPENLVFRSLTPEGLSIVRTFRFYPNQYKIDMNMTVINASGKPVRGAFTAQIHALRPKGKQRYYSFTGLAILINGKLETIKIKKPSDEKVFKGRINWLAFEDDYFISAIVPEITTPGTFKGHLLPSGLLEGTFATPPVSLHPSQQISTLYTLYLGPRDLGILKKVGKDLSKAVDFGWFDIIAKALLYVLLFFNKFINNYGVSIILLTVLIKVLFWPLTHKSYKSMKEMQKIQPIMAKIREKYKDDKQKMNMEMMALYKTYKVNPMSGCLPMLIQLPVFFALYRLLGNSIELRHAPFMLWIKDLSAPDRLFTFPFSIPFMSPPYGIPVLTLLMGVSMFVQQKMTPTPGDPAQAKIMMLMPVIFTFMFINFPSGLVLYWLVNNILSIGQQYRILKTSA